MTFLLTRVTPAQTDGEEFIASDESSILSVTFYLKSFDPLDAFLAKTPISLGAQVSPRLPGDSFFFTGSGGNAFKVVPTRLLPGSVTIYYRDGVELGWGAVTQTAQEFTLPLYLTNLETDQKLFLVGVDYDELFLNVIGVTGAGPTYREKPSETLRVIGEGRIAFQVELLGDYLKSPCRLHVADLQLRYNGEPPPDGQLIVQPHLLAKPIGGKEPDEAKAQDANFDGAGGSYGEALHGVVKLLPAYFVRGNVDSSLQVEADGAINYAPDLADIQIMLRASFIGDVEVPCRDAGDVNDDGVLDLSDTIWLLNHMYRSGPPPPPPYPKPGLDDMVAGDMVADDMVAGDLGCQRPVPYFVPVTVP